MLKSTEVRIAAVLLVLVAGWTLRASAQQASARDSGVSRALSRAAHTHSTARVVLLSGDSATGSVLRSGNVFRIKTTQITLSQVQRIEVLTRGPDPLGNGLAIGAAAGGLTGLLLSAYLSGYADSPRPSALPGILISAGIGALGGLVLDYTVVHRSWQTLWP